MKKYKKIYIEITNICNLNCSFCSKVELPKKYMSKDEFIHILNEIKDYTNTIYLHVKGEPLLHPRVIDFLNIAEEYNLKVSLTTNGVLFPKLAKELGNCNSLHKINFSLHSENNKKNYCEEIFENIKYLDSKIVIYRLWALNDYKLDRKSQDIVKRITKFYNLSNGFVEKIEKENNVKINSTTYVDKDIEFVWPEITEYESNSFCYALKTQIAILVDGTVVPCCLDSNAKIPLGNIFKDKMSDIINSNRYRNLKKSFQDRKPCEELCKSCTFKERLTK